MRNIDSLRAAPGGNTYAAYRAQEAYTEGLGHGLPEHEAYDAAIAAWRQVEADLVDEAIHDTFPQS